MKKDEQQMTYETPEVEAIECKLEASIADGSCIEKNEGGHGGDCDWD